MKKIGYAVLSAALVTCAAVAKDKDLTNTEAHSTTPLQIGIADPIQYPRSNCIVEGLRLNMFYGASFAVYGVDLGLVGVCRDKMTGAALQAANWVDNDFCGAQAGLLFNVVNGDTTGVQFGLLLNNDRGSVWGVQAASLNVAGSLFGVQGGFINWDKSLSQGFQLGLVNIDLNEFDGCSASLVNYADSFTGLQLGLLNVVSKDGSGVQFGLLNAADTFSGVQLGLLNLIGNAPVPVLPFINGNF